MIPPTSCNCDNEEELNDAIERFYEWLKNSIDDYIQVSAALAVDTQSGIFLCSVGIEQSKMTSFRTTYPIGGSDRTFDIMASMQNRLLEDGALLKHSDWHGPVTHILTIHHNNWDHEYGMRCSDADAVKRVLKLGGSLRKL